MLQFVALMLDATHHRPRRGLCAITVTLGQWLGIEKSSLALCLISPPYSWWCPAESPNIDKGDRDVETIAEADETRVGQRHYPARPQAPSAGLATKPTVQPSTRPNPVTMFLQMTPESGRSRLRRSS